MDGLRSWAWQAHVITGISKLARARHGPLVCQQRHGPVHDDEDEPNGLMDPMEAPSPAFPPVPVFDVNEARDRIAQRIFDEPAQAIYLKVLAETGRKAHACQAAGVGMQTLYHTRKTDKVFAELETEAAAHYADKWIGKVQQLGYEGVLEPIIGRIGKDEDGVVTHKRVHNTALIQMEARRVVDAYHPKVDVNVQAKVGVVVVRRPAVSVDDWQKEYGGQRLPTNPLDGLPGIDASMMKSLTRRKTPDEE